MRSRALALSLSLSRSRARSLSLSLSFSIAGKGERLVRFGVNAHSVSLMATLRKGRKIGVFWRERSERETSPNFRAGGCTEVETVGNFHHGGVQSLRRPQMFVKGVRRA